MTTWNQKHLDYEIETGLWRSCHGRFGLVLKSKASRLRDWNRSSWKVIDKPLWLSWNQKHLDYEIETKLNNKQGKQIAFAWNQKHLDYEIETKHKCIPKQSMFGLEIKSISITRLKLGFGFGVRVDYLIFLKSKASRLRDWNKAPISDHDHRSDLKSKASRLRDWNNCSVYGRPPSVFYTWNQKHLDYEIETIRVC